MAPEQIEAAARAQLAIIDPDYLARVDARLASDARATELKASIEEATGCDVLNNSLGCRRDQVEYIVRFADGSVVFGQAWKDETHHHELALIRLQDVVAVKLRGDRAMMETAMLIDAASRREVA